MTHWRIIKRDIRDELGEGTLWSARENALYWVDIVSPALNRLALGDGHVSRWAMPEPLGWIVERAQGGFIAGFQSGFAELDLSPLRIRHIANPEPHFPGNRMNDGKADASGAIWCGTMDMAEQQACGAFYRCGPDWRIERVDEGYGVPNGPAFSPDGHWLYHSDTARRTVYRFARLGVDRLGPRAPFITFAEADGHPDGMTVDVEGCLWVAHWGGSRVSRFRPDGTFDRAIALPACQITNLAFCGERLDRLFVSSAAVGLSASEVDGALFEVKPGVAGLLPGVFPA